MDQDHDSQSEVTAPW